MLYYTYHTDMKNRGLELCSAILDAASLIIFIFSLQLKLKGIVSGLSLLAILTFSSIWFIEHLRKQEVANINVETPPLSHTDIMIRTSYKNRAINSMVEAKIEDWKKQQEQKIQETNAKYLGREKLVFCIGVVIILVIFYFLAFS